MTNQTTQGGETALIGLIIVALLASIAAYALWRWFERL